MTIDDVDVAAVLNIHDSHVGFDGIRGPEDLARIKSDRRAARPPNPAFSMPTTPVPGDAAVAGRARLPGRKRRGRQRCASISLPAATPCPLRPTPEGDEIVIVERALPAPS